MSERRQPFVAGNWKCHTTLAEATRLADDLKRRIGRLRTVEMGVIPPFPFIERVASRLAGEAVQVGAQDIYAKGNGAYTGAVSGAMLKSIGTDFVLVGHSERRLIFGDDDAVVSAKLQAALDSSIRVILCIGERLAERDAGKAASVCQAQLAAALTDIPKEAFQNVTIAYEPVWAIGTGRVASPAQAQDIHSVIRTWITEHYDSDVAASTRIQYGGSVKPNNISGLILQPDVDGALVGGASLDADSFSAIVTASIDSSAEADSARNRF